MAQETWETAPGSWRDIVSMPAGFVSTYVAGTYLVTRQGAIASAGANSYLAAFYLNPLWYLNPVLRLVGFISNGAVAPAMNFTWGLSAVTVDGGIATAGALLINGGTLTTPAANVDTPLTSPSVVLATAGYYAISVATSAAPAVGAFTSLNLQLQVMNAPTN